MLSTTDVINDLRNHRQVCAEITMIEKVLHKMQNDSPHMRYNRAVLERHSDELLLKKETVESWLQLLTTEELFLVRTHLIQGLDWAKTIVEHERMWGIMNGRSERTLKRIQSKAVDRIVACMNQIELLSQTETKEVK